MIGCAGSLTNGSAYARITALAFRARLPATAPMTVAAPIGCSPPSPLRITFQRQGTVPAFRAPSGMNGRGLLSRRKREEFFDMLTDEEVAQMEGAVQEAYRPA